MSDWQDLLGGSADNATSDIFWTGLIGLAVFGAIVGILLYMRSRSAPEMPAKVVYEGLNGMNGINADPVALVTDGRTENETVRAKHFSAMWGNVEDDDDHAAMPMADEYYGFSKFQQALLSGVERDISIVPAMKVHSPKDLESWNIQLQPLRETLKRSNKTLEQWIEENNVQLPEDVIEMWDAVKNMKPVTREDFTISNVSAEEAASIVRDSIQSIPNANVDVASTVMREILHARAEAQSLGLTVPELSLEQKRTLEFWKASTQNPASDIAAKLLSRA